MKEKNLPRYVEDEVKVFHPFFEECAKEAIKNLSKNNLIVSHHKNINGIIVYYSIEDLISKKIVLLVESKETQPVTAPTASTSGKDNTKTIENPES